MMLIPNTVQEPRRELHDMLWNMSEPRRKEIENVLATPPAVSPLDGLTGVFIRFTKMHILDNHTSFLFWDTAADVYPLVMAVSDAADQPFQLQFQSVFNDINDGDILPIANGFDFARTTKDIPNFIDLHVVLMRSAEKTRQIAQAVNEALASEQGKNITDSLSSALSGANPLVGTAMSIGASLLSLVTAWLSKEKDEQIFYGVASYAQDPDNLGIGCKQILTDKKNAVVEFEIIGQHS